MLPGGIALYCPGSPFRRAWFFAPEPGHEGLACPDEAVGLHGEEDGTEVVDDLIGPAGFGVDPGVQADERVPQS